VLPPLVFAGIAGVLSRRRGPGDAGLQPKLGDAGAFYDRRRAGLAQPPQAHETGSESVISALMAGAAAVAFWLLFWPRALRLVAGSCWQWRFSASWWFREPSAIGVEHGRTGDPLVWVGSGPRRAAPCRRRSSSAPTRS
jgi:hypothetical protein